MGTDTEIDDALWAKTFAESQDTLNRLADETVEEYREGQLEKFDSEIVDLIRDQNLEIVKNLLSEISPYAPSLNPAWFTQIHSKLSLETLRIVSSPEYRQTRQFCELLLGLPKNVKQLAYEALRLFLRDPNHPNLQMTRINWIRELYSVRIGLGYRALALSLAGEEVEDGVLVWIWIGSNAEYGKLIGR